MARLASSGNILTSSATILASGYSRVARSFFRAFCIRIGLQ